MKIKDLVEKCYYASVGYVESLDDLDKLEQYLLYNFEIIKLFKGVIFSTTYKDDSLELAKGVEEVWRKYFPDSVSINNGVSRGHSFGACDNDDAVFDYCKKNNIEWMCKSANDIIFDSNLLEITIPVADFYYLNGIGYGGMVKYNFDIETMIKEDFYPQNLS